MNEIIPPAEPGKEPPALPEAPYKKSPPNKKSCAAMGLGLFVVSAALAFAFPPLALVGLALAIASLFFEGYRCIFLGYILTFGVLLLGTILYCVVHPMRLD